MRAAHKMIMMMREEYKDLCVLQSIDYIMPDSCLYKNIYPFEEEELAALPMPINSPSYMAKECRCLKLRKERELHVGNGGDRAHWCHRKTRVKYESVKSRYKLIGL
ncbi:hypothetical protein KQX54_004919 [Cotesia glomerata]|uniref:Uncharacterized protein n=1 Tax=Cotesia glomerata TaxID=32391 RepID=A0AAV7INH5_COTGL|nr:hypothetical protein KQX54_004919 [Cotesia glomerata]